MRGWARLAAAVARCRHFLRKRSAARFCRPRTRFLDQIEARRQALLQLMLRDPSKLDIAFEYASLSSQVGDHEAAVSTLERMLIFAPNTCSLRRPNAARTGTCRRGAGHQYIASFQPFSALS
jgi:thioredoxin-like negative regulator of GroEL